MRRINDSSSPYYAGHSYNSRLQLSCKQAIFKCTLRCVGENRFCLHLPKCWDDSARIFLARRECQQTGINIMNKVGTTFAFIFLGLFSIVTVALYIQHKTEAFHIGIFGIVMLLMGWIAIESRAWPSSNSTTKVRAMGSGTTSSGGSDAAVLMAVVAATSETVCASAASSDSSPCNTDT